MTDAQMIAAERQRYTLEQLQAMGDRELDAALAGILEPKPGALALDDVRFHGIRFRAGTAEPVFEPTALTSPDSPRSLMDGVEAEIERLGVDAHNAYVMAILNQLPPRYNGNMLGLVTAFARVRVIAAVIVLQEVSHA